MMPRTWTFTEFYGNGGRGALDFIDELVAEHHAMLETQGATEAEIETALLHYEHALLAALMAGSEQFVRAVEAGALK